ncbi:MAG: hypothetical protein ACXABJ_11015 [Candidatus Heimdallarchaeaceae archaeon]|jgi:hypothetical protein
MEEVEIYWRGPYTWDEVLGEGYGEKEDLYAITWEPPKRQARTLYIGIAFRQYIATRLKGYHDADLWIHDYYGEKSIRYYFGEILLEDGKKRSEQRVKDVEAAIIYYHYKYEDICDANEQSTSNYYGRDVEIRNSGDIPPRIVDFRSVGCDWIKI